jgi:hypothetical protein
MPESTTNVGASVRARLQNLSRDTGQSFELVLTRYALERLLYRLGRGSGGRRRRRAGESKPVAGQGGSAAGA